MNKKLKMKEIEENIKDMSIDSALDYLSLLGNDYGVSLAKLIVKYEKRKEVFLKELKRLKEMSKYEEEAYLNGCEFIAGIDEAGRGPLVGPVVAACVILPKDIIIEKLNDSKKLSEKVRENLYEIITEKAVSYGVGIVDEKCIDEINILNATKKAMNQAISQLNQQPDLLLIDAIRLEDCKIEQKSIIKGDSLSVSIAAASIIAKVTRDRLIKEMDEIYPQYSLAKNKGYGTKEHIEAIKNYGICPIHRVSFTKNFV